MHRPLVCLNGTLVASDGVLKWTHRTCVESPHVQGDRNTSAERMASAVVPPKAPNQYLATFATIDAVLQQALAAHGDVILYVCFLEPLARRYVPLDSRYLYAERDPQSHLSWCPDCQLSDDMLRAAFSRAQNEGLSVPTFVDASVGPRDGYKVRSNSLPNSSHLKCCDLRRLRATLNTRIVCTHKLV